MSVLDDVTAAASEHRNAILEVMVREFLAKTGASIEDCVLVQQIQGERLTWHLEVRKRDGAG